MSESDSLLQFPCDYPIKVIGHGQGDFEVAVVARVREHAPDLSEAAVRSRASQGGKYLAVTVTVRAVSQAQIDTIYRSLSDWDQALMVL